MDPIIEAVFRECKKNKLSYRRIALISVGDILETLNIDKFAEVYALVEEILAKVIVIILLCFLPQLATLKLIFKI